jgi:uncharacterized OB-fold protein
MGPCLCGDPYCSKCGSPNAAKVEAAEVMILEAFSVHGFTLDEYQLAQEVSIAAVEAHRKLIRGILAENKAEHAMEIIDLEMEIDRLKGNIQ